MNSAIYSHKSDEWETPQAVFDELNKEFAFNLDPCATKDNAKCKRFYTAEENGILQNWGGAECFVIHHTAK